MKKAKTLLALLLALLLAMGSTVCAFAADAAEESEDNSTMATANALALGTAINGTISATTADVEDVDWFKLASTEIGIITVTLAHNVVTGADSSYFNIAVKNADGEDIASFKSKGTDASVSNSFSAAPGTYYVVVESGNVHDATLGYSVTATINTAALVEEEDNGKIESATEMALSVSGSNKLYYGTITAGDVDYYKVTFASPALASIGIYNTFAEKGDYKATLIKVVDGANGAYEEKSIAGIEISSSDVQSNSASIGVNGGTYYLKIEGVNGATGGYQVRVFSGGSIVNIEYEYNNEYSQANLVSLDKALTANLFDADDVDCFKFTAGANNNGYQFTVASYDNAKEEVDGKWEIAMVNQQGKEVTLTFDTSDKTKLVAVTETLDAGTYYVAVSGGSDFTDETYTVQLKAVEQKDEEKEPSLIDRIKALDWSTFFENFTSWLPSVNIGGIISDLYQSIAKFVTEFLFANT